MENQTTREKEGCSLSGFYEWRFRLTAFFRFLSFLKTIFKRDESTVLWFRQQKLNLKVKVSKGYAI